MFRLCRQPWHGNVFILFLLWYSVRPLFVCSGYFLPPGHAVLSSTQSFFLRYQWCGCHYACCGHRHNYFLQPGHAVQANTQSIFLRYLCCDTIMFAVPLAQLFPATLTSAQSIFLRYLCCGTIMLAVVLQPGHAVLASTQSIILRYLWSGTILFDVVIGKTFSCSLGMQYLPLLSLSLSDV